MEKKLKIRGVWGKFFRRKPGEHDFEQGNINYIVVR